MVSNIHHHAVFVEARCRTRMSGCAPPTYGLCRYPRPFTFHPPSPSKQSLSLPHLSLDMLGLPSDWRCTCVHTHAFHIHHPTITTHIFLYCSTSLVLVSQTFIFYTQSFSRQPIPPRSLPDPQLSQDMLGLSSDWSCTNVHIQCLPHPSSCYQKPYFFCFPTYPYYTAF